MPADPFPSSPLFRCYRAAIVITMASLLYAGVILFIAILGAKIDLFDSYGSGALNSIFFLFFLFPGLSSLYIWTDYRKRVATSNACRSKKIEIVGIASCLPTLLICFSAVAFFGLA